MKRYRNGSVKFIFSFIGISLTFFCLSVSSAFAIKKPCDPREIGTETSVVNWSGKKVNFLWLAHAPADCPGTQFPLIYLQEPQAQAFIHVVELSTVAPEGMKKNEWGMQLRPQKNWLFLDVTHESRSDRIPFYNAPIPNNKFFDNPKWGHLSEESKIKARSWRGRIYAVKVIDGKDCEAVWGVEWGFDQKMGSTQVLPYKPKGLPKSQWRYDWNLIQNQNPSICHK